MLTLLCCMGAWAQPSDVLSGGFTINASGDKVQFSKGNLQYVNGNWQFAEHQYDYIGNNQSDNNKDLFAFNGYSTPDASWFNMSHAQWKYLLATRSVTNSLSTGARYTMATLGGAYKGLIIFPDDYTHPDGTGFVAGTYNGRSDFTATVSLEGWALMEAAGCVFLPAAGYKSYASGFGGFGEAVDINTTTSYDDNFFYTPVFKSDNLNYDDKSYKQSLIPVRLAQLKTNLQKDADGYYLIGSVQDWKDFAALVEIIPKANAKMTADIDLGNDQTHISGTWKGESSPEHYGGIFDGQGHTLTVNYNDDKYFKAPFGHCYGATIKNLHVAGYIYARSQNPHTAGVMCNSTGNDLVQNVWVSATINTNSDAAGAFIGLNNSGASTIRDCLFTGTITTVNSTGGDGCFLGRVRYGSSNIINCLSTGTFVYYGSGSFDGTHTNCYVKQFDGTIPAAMQLTAEQLADGTITYKLQNNREEEVWVQDVLTNQPQLAIFANKYTVPSSGIGTFSAKANFTLPEGLEAYYCKNYDSKEGTISVERINGVVPAETGVLLRGTAGATYTLTGTNSEAATVTDNALVAVTEKTSIAQESDGYVNFGLSGGEFKKVNAAGGTVKANRAYLHILKSSLPTGAKSIALAWDGETTGIANLNVDANDNFDANAPMYNLAGQRVGKSYKGIVVVNGKKVLIK